MGPLQLMGITTAAVAAIFLPGMLLYHFMISEPVEQSAETIWLNQQIERCSAMRSRLSYDEATRTAECFRTPFMRKPKKMFAAKFEAKEE